MQQNVQSEYKIQNNNYSLQRNSIPSKGQESQNFKVVQKDKSNHNELDSIQIDGKHYKASAQAIQRLKLIQEEIKKQKQMITKLKRQNQEQNQNVLQKSFLSLNKHQFINNQHDNSNLNIDTLQQTKTQIDYSLFQTRKFNATKELQSQEDKYRQNIRKIQLKRNQIKKRIIQDKQIPIRIMDLKEFELKKQKKIEQNARVQKQQDKVNSLNQLNKQQNQQSIKNKKQEDLTLQQKQSKQQKVQQSSKSINTSKKITQSNQIIQSKLIKQSQLSRKTQSIKQKTLEVKQNMSHLSSNKKSSQINQQSSNLSSKNINQPLISAAESISKLKDYQNGDQNIIEFQQYNPNSKQLTNKSHISLKDNQVLQNNSKISARTSQKKYSVKKSSVIVPQSNDSIKQIEQRKSKRSFISKNSDKQSSVNKPITHQFIEQKKQKLIKSNKEQSVSNKAQSLQNSKSSSKQNQLKDQLVINRNAEKMSEKSQFNNSRLQNSNINEKKSQNNKQTFLYDQKSQKKGMEITQNACSVKQKSIKSKHSSKKQQKVQLMYIPHAPKSPSHKSFKKTDKSIQWSQIDISMYGKSNQTNNNNSHSNLLQEINDHRIVKLDERLEAQKHQHLSTNKINMKKVKLQKAFFEQPSQKEKTSQKSNNLVPIDHPNKQKSQKLSAISRSSQINKGSIIASRQGSVKQKHDKYDKFKRQHSLNSKKLQQKKQELVQQIKNRNNNNKAASYRSRKSNVISSSSKAKPKTSILQQKLADNIKKQSSAYKNQVSEFQTSRILISKQQISILHKQIKELEQKLQSIQKKQQIIIREKEEQKNNTQRLHQESKKLQNQENNEKDDIQMQAQKLSAQVQQHQKNPTEQSKSQKFSNKNVEQQTKQLPKQVSSHQNNQVQNSPQPIKQVESNKINNLSLIEAQFTKQKQSLQEQVSRLRKIIRDLQIQKIKSIDNDQTIFSDKNQNIMHQNNKQTLQANSMIQMKSISQENRQKSKSPFGKIVKNTSPQKSRLTQRLQIKNKSNQKHFRISVNKKSSIHSQNINKNQNLLNKTFDSVQLNSIIKRNQNQDDEQKNDLLGKRRNQFYPISQKQGYVVANAEFSPSNNQRQRQNQQSRIINSEQKKVHKAQITKEQVLQKFHKTNRQFHNFVESSRIINETNSSMSSQNNFFLGALNQTNQSNDFLVKKNINKNQEFNPQNTSILNKLSSSNLQFNQQSPNKQFQQSFTRIISQIKNDPEYQQSQLIPEIQIRDIQIPQLPKTPDITLDQDQLMELAKQTFKLFDIEVKNDDLDFNMKKYKNCVIFTKGSQTILWHYNGKFYLGGWKHKENGEGEKTGYGIQIVPQKHIYKGQFMNGKKNGTGILKSTNGNIYDGQWIQGIKNGQGIFYQVTTKVAYQGQWKDGKKNGFGLLKFSQNQYYQGTFLKSVKQGYGTEVFVNGDKYKGQYRKGKFHGKGKYSWANGSVYEGDFFEGMRSGYGTWKSAKTNFDVYVGAYQNDKKCGFGRYVWSNGCIYEGSFAEDVKHGKGKLIYTDGKQIKGVWEQGSLLEAISQNPKQKHQDQRLKRTSKLSGIASKIK